jgi:DNA-binding NarL/FixJ family response regulator
MIRVLVVDDQALVRGGFRSILEGQPDIEVIGEAGDGLEAVEMAQTLDPHVVLMDVRMPRMDGIAATAKLIDSPNGPRVLVLTTFDSDEYVYQALRAGASGFLLKTAPPRELAAAIRTVAAGEALLAPEITRRLIDDYVARGSRTARLPAGFDQLTDRETQVLTRIARGRSNSEIAAELHLSQPTVKTHVSRIFTKLDARDRVQAVVLAYDAGLVRPGAAEQADTID